MSTSDLPAYIDTTKASIARVYDAFLGGKDNYAVDQAVYQKVLQVTPQAADYAKDNRSWLIRAVRFLVANAGIDQFLDCGSGLPTAENVHHAAQRINPEATVVYVDIDPVVAAHGRALLEENEHTHFIAGDLTKPAELLKDPVVTQHLDFTRPLALIQCGTMHHVSDGQNPRQIMADYIDALPSGSFVGLTHFIDPADGSEHSQLAKDVEAAFLASSMGTGWFRTPDEIKALLNGLELIDPGLVILADWWPDGPRINALPECSNTIAGAVGRKP